MGSGTTPHALLAIPLGRALARMGVHLLTGGGGGVMEAVSRAFHEASGREGLVIGVLPAGDAYRGRRDASLGCHDAAPGRPDASMGRGDADSGHSDADPGTPSGYPHPWVELAIRTHLDARGDDGSVIRSRNHINILSSDVIVAFPGSAGTASEVELAIRYGRPLILLGDTARAERLSVSVPTAESVEEAVEFVRRAVSSGGASLPPESGRLRPAPRRAGARDPSQ